MSFLIGSCAINSDYLAWCPHPRGATESELYRLSVRLKCSNVWTECPGGYFMSRSSRVTGTNCPDLHRTSLETSRADYELDRRPRRRSNSVSARDQSFAAMLQRSSGDKLFCYWWIHTWLMVIILYLCQSRWPPAWQCPLYLHQRSIGGCHVQISGRIYELVYQPATLPATLGWHPYLLECAKTTNRISTEEVLYRMRPSRCITQYNQEPLGLSCQCCH